jgi:hypothetical protein
VEERRHGVEAGDLRARNGGYSQQKWTPGEPKTSFWCGLNVDRKHSLPVTTLRCPKCGYLEFHAPPGPLAS